MYKIARVAFLAVLLGSQAFSQQVKVKAFGSIPDVGWRVSQDDRDAALLQAKQNALKKYGSTIDNSARYELYQEVLPSLYGKVDELIVSYYVISDGKNDSTKHYEIFIEAVLDANLIELEVKKHSPSGASNSRDSYTAGGGEPSLLVFLFVGREAASVTKSDGKKVEFVKTTEQGDEVENVSTGADGVGVSYDSSNLQVRESGGKKIEKADITEWRAKTVGDVDSVLNEIFTKANYECIDPRDVDGLDIEAFIEDYSAGDDISPATRREALALLRDYEVPYFATGCLDIPEPPSPDPVTGQTRAVVRVSAKITDLRKRLPRTVASIRSVQYQGLGASSAEAKLNALNSAAMQAGQDLVDQLRNKGIR